MFNKLTTCVIALINLKQIANIYTILVLLTRDAIFWSKFKYLLSQHFQRFIIINQPDLTWINLTFLAQLDQTSKMLHRRYNRIQKIESTQVKSVHPTNDKRVWYLSLVECASWSLFSAFFFWIRPANFWNFCIALHGQFSTVSPKFLAT